MAIKMKYIASELLLATVIMYTQKLQSILSLSLALM